MRCTAIVGGCSIVPDDQNFIVGFKTPNGAYVTLATVLLPPLPIRTSDNSRTDALHLSTIFALCACALSISTVAACLTFDPRAPPIARTRTLINALLILFHNTRASSENNLHSAFFPDLAVEARSTVTRDGDSGCKSHRDSYGNILDSMEGQAAWAGNLWRRYSRGGTCWAVGCAATVYFCWR